MDQVSSVEVSGDANLGDLRLDVVERLLTAGVLQLFAAAVDSFGLGQPLETCPAPELDPPSRTGSWTPASPTVVSGPWCGTNADVAGGGLTGG